MSSYQQIDLSEWVLVGEGYNGQAYVSKVQLAHGHYMMDLAHLYKMMMEDSRIPQVQELTHMSQEQMIQFWEAFAKACVEALLA